jgi:predicted Zn-dependent protease
MIAGMGSTGSASRLLRGIVACLALACAPLTTEREVALGKGAAQQVEQEMGLVRDPELVAYVQALGARLAALSPRKDLAYDFHVVDMAEANAFALPGGHIYVSRGLLAIANSEDELANVIGHEIGHVAAHHHAQQEARAQQVGVASVLGTLAAAVIGGAEAAQVVGELGQTAGAGYLAAHSRDQEREADEIGQTLAANGGWNPAGMPEFLDTLGRETTLAAGQERMPGFLDTHPATPERVESGWSRARTLPRARANPIVRDRAAFLTKLDGLVVDEDPAGGLFDGAVFRQPALDFRMTFPSGWHTANSPSAVAAVAPDQTGLIQLGLAGEGSDPRAAAQKALANQDIPVIEHGPVSIGALRGYQVRMSQASQQGKIGGLFTWIALGGQIYRVECIAAEARFARFAPLCASTTKSFRPLDASDRDKIQAHVLRIATARSGETLASLGARTGNVWSPEQTAVANAMADPSAIPPDRRLKIAVAVPYRPGAASR